MLLLILGFVSLSLGAEVCSPPCGCFQDGFPFNDRPLPETLQVQQLQFTLYTPTNPNNPVAISWDNIPGAWSRTRPTKFVIHGWNDSPATWDGIRTAFFARNHNINLIAVNWSTGASRLFYPQSASNTRVVGACTAHLGQALVNAGANLADLHCIGHSLGGQACGYMGKASSGQMGRISGLDPAGPWFETGDTRLHLYRTDSRFVDVMHTDADGLGMLSSVGHIDFFPNNGKDQPGCGGDTICDHSFCKSYYEQSISNTNCRFWSRPCATEADGNNGNCNPAGCSGAPCGRMGYYATATSASGRHYLTTTASAPYCVS